MRTMWMVAIAVAACGGKGSSTDDSEAEHQLRKLEKSAKRAFEMTSAFPKGMELPTPSASCCSQPDKVCKPQAADWAGPMWTALEFSISEPTHFQYSYESDGKSFTATATGGCDGSVRTIKLQGQVSPSGNVTTAIMKF